MTKKPKKEKKVKAWAVYSTERDDLADTIFTTKKDAQKYFSVVWEETRLKYPNLPIQNLRRIKSRFKIIPCTIVYSPLTTRPIKKK